MLPTLPDLERLAREAGQLLRLGYDREHQVDYKGVIDLVTEVDRQSEAFLLGEIQRLFPDHRIVSEEIGVVPGADSDQWYVDPLDGTVNYAHGVPFFCVSIAYARSGTVTLGAVYDPMRDELFTAERGRGAWLNGKPIHASAAQDLQKSVLRRRGATGWLLGIDAQSVGRGRRGADRLRSRRAGHRSGRRSGLHQPTVFPAGSRARSARQNARNPTGSVIFVLLFATFLQLAGLRPMI
jgi:fructose-1,6-bisphosphatase/inositol monophosphatase family enzyme